MKPVITAAKSFLSLVGAVCLVLLFMTPSPAAASSAPNDYIAFSPSEVVLLEFTVSSSSVVGVAYTDTVEGTAPNLQLVPATATFNGTDNGGTLTLYFNGSSTPTFGSVDGQQLSLQGQQPGGGVGTVTFYRSSVAEFNGQVAAWQARITKANQAASAAAAAVAAKAAAAAAKAQHQQQLLDRLNQTIGAVDSDLSNLSAPTDLTTDESDLATDVSDVNTDLSDVKTDMSNVATDVSEGEAHSEVCSDVSTAYADAATTAADTRIILTDAQARSGGVGQDIRGVQQAMASAPGDYSTYWRAQHALPTYHPTTPIPPLKAALATGQSVINGAVRQVDSYIDQANGIVAQAYRLVNVADNTHHCGPPKKAPVLGHVTPALLGA